jgi:hypothetical protein
MTSRDPFTGFGDDTNTSIKFGIRAVGGVTPDWEGGKRINQFEIPNSDRTVTQIGGAKPQDVTFEVLVGSRADIQMLKNLIGVRATLRYLRGITTDEGGTVRTYLGTQYLELPNALLMKVAKVVNLRDGRSLAELTFQRAGDSSAYYGFSTYAEDLP